MDGTFEPEKSSMSLGKQNLKKFFIAHLDKVYTAKSHLITKLPEIAGHVHFTDLKDAIHTTVTDVKKQMARMDIVYDLLETSHTSGTHSGLTGLVDDSFKDIQLHSNHPELRDMSVLFYLQNIESMEMASFQMLQISSVKLEDKNIKQLIKENYEEAKADRTLMLLIAAKYITSN